MTDLLLEPSAASKTSPAALAPLPALDVAPLRGDADFAGIKRFVEALAIDPALRDLAATDARAVALACGVDLDPYSFQAVWQRLAGIAEADFVPPSERALAYYTTVGHKLGLRQLILDECGHTDPRHARWRRRQIERCYNEIGTTKTEAIVFAPATFELADGCSVGCWFCGVGATRLASWWPYDEANAAEWRQTLAGLHDLMGPGMRWAFCYWATDPLDNPDYERFVCDFHDIVGVFPQTTTAIGQRHLERTRSLLRASEARDVPLNRFSVLNVKQMKAIFAAFSAEDLRNVELIPQNTGSVMRKAVAGKARDKAEARAAELVADDGNTIACVAGFLINMVTRSIRLIAPCRSTPANPLGYVVIAEDRFADAAELLAIADEMIGGLPQTVTDLKSLRFVDAFRFTPTEQGFQLESHYVRRKHEHPVLGAYLRDLGQAVAEGGLTAEEIALMSFYRFGVPEQSTIAALNGMFDKGVFDETAG